MKYYFNFCSIVVLFLVFGGCKRDPITPASVSGNISGYVQLYDADGNPDISSAGVNVTISGLSSVSQTNDSGQWTLSGLSQGVYTIIFSKEGYGLTKIIAYQFVGNGTAYVDEVGMSRPSTEIINFQDFSVMLNPDSTRSYNCVAAMPPPYTEIRSVLLCIGTDSAALAVDPTSAPLVSAFQKAGSGYDGNFNINSVLL